MGKKRIEIIQKIEDPKIRKVTYCKRKKGILKKSMELALLCDLRIFMFLYDPHQRRVIHFASDPDLDILDLFNIENQREFYSNNDYEEIGGRLIDENAISDEEDEELPQETRADGKKVPQRKKGKQGRIKRDQNKITSTLGNLNAQKIVVPQQKMQILRMVDVNQQGFADSPEMDCFKKRGAKLFETELIDNKSGTHQINESVKNQEGAMLSEMDKANAPVTNNQEDTINAETMQQVNYLSNGQEFKQPVANDQKAATTAIQLDKEGVDKQAPINQNNPLMPGQEQTESKKSIQTSQIYSQDNLMSMKNKILSSNRPQFSGAAPVNPDGTINDVNRMSSTGLQQAYQYPQTRNTEIQEPRAFQYLKISDLNLPINNDIPANQQRFIQNMQEAHLSTLNQFLQIYHQYMSQRDMYLIKTFFLRILGAIKENNKIELANQGNQFIMHRILEANQNQCNLQMLQQNTMPDLQELNFILECIENEFGISEAQTNQQMNPRNQMYGAQTSMQGQCDQDPAGQMDGQHPVQMNNQQLPDPNNGDYHSSNGHNLMRKRDMKKMVKIIHNSKSENTPNDIMPEKEQIQETNIDQLQSMIRNRMISQKTIRMRGTTGNLPNIQNSYRFDPITGLPNPGYNQIQGLQPPQVHNSMHLDQMSHYLRQQPNGLAGNRSDMMPIEAAQKVGVMKNRFGQRMTSQSVNSHDGKSQDMGDKESTILQTGQHMMPMFNQQPKEGFKQHQIQQFNQQMMQTMQKSIATSQLQEQSANNISQHGKLSDRKLPDDRSSQRALKQIIETNKRKRLTTGNMGKIMMDNESLNRYQGQDLVKMQKKQSEQDKVSNNMEMQGGVAQIQPLSQQPSQIQNPPPIFLQKSYDQNHQNKSASSNKELKKPMVFKLGESVGTTNPNQGGQTSPYKHFVTIEGKLYPMVVRSNSGSKSLISSNQGLQDPATRKISNPFPTPPNQNFQPGQNLQAHPQQMHNHMMQMNQQQQQIQFRNSQDQNDNPLQQQARQNMHQMFFQQNGNQMMAQPKFAPENGHMMKSFSMKEQQSENNRMMPNLQNIKNIQVAQQKMIKQAQILAQRRPQEQGLQKQNFEKLNESPNKLYPGSNKTIELLLKDNRVYKKLSPNVKQPSKFQQKSKEDNNLHSGNINNQTPPDARSNSSESKKNHEMYLKIKNGETKSGEPQIYLYDRKQKDVNKDKLKIQADQQKDQQQLFMQQQQEAIDYQNALQQQQQELNHPPFGTNVSQQQAQWMYHHQMRDPRLQQHALPKQYNHYFENPVQDSNNIQQHYQDLKFRNQLQQGENPLLPDLNTPQNKVNQIFKKYDTQLGQVGDHQYQQHQHMQNPDQHNMQDVGIAQQTAAHYQNSQMWEQQLEHNKTFMTIKQQEQYQNNQIMKDNAMKNLKDARMKMIEKQQRGAHQNMMHHRQQIGDLQDNISATHDTMSDISKLNLTTLSNINRTVDRAPVSSKVATPIKGSITSGLNPSNQHSSNHQIQKVIEQNQADQQVTEDQEMLDENDQSPNKNLKEIPDQVSKASYANISQAEKESKVNICSQSTICRVQNDQNNFFQNEKKKNVNINPPKTPVEIYQKKESGDINPMLKRRPSVQSQIYDPRKMIEFTNPKNDLVLENHEAPKSHQGNMNEDNNLQQIILNPNQQPAVEKTPELQLQSKNDQQKAAPEIQSTSDDKKLRSQKEVDDLKTTLKQTKNILHDMDIENLSMNASEYANVPLKTTAKEKPQDSQVNVQLMTPKVQMLPKLFPALNNHTQMNMGQTNFQALANQQLTQVHQFKPTNQQATNVFKDPTADHNFNRVQDNSESISGNSRNKESSLSGNSNFRYRQDILRPQNKQTTGNFAHMDFKTSKNNSNTASLQNVKQQETTAVKPVQQVTDLQNYQMKTVVETEKPVDPRRQQSSMSFINTTGLVDSRMSNSKIIQQFQQDQNKNIKPRKMISFSGGDKFIQQLPQQPIPPVQPSYLEILNQGNKAYQPQNITAQAQFQSPSQILQSRAKDAKNRHQASQMYQSQSEQGKQPKMLNPNQPSNFKSRVKDLSYLPKSMIDDIEREQQPQETNDLRKEINYQQQQQSDESQSSVSASISQTKSNNTRRTKQTNSQMGQSIQKM